MDNRTNTPTINPWLYRYAIFLVACTLLLVVSGAYITSSEEQAASTDLSIFAGTGRVASLQAILTVRNHSMLAIAIGIFTIILAAWLMTVEKKGPLRLLGVGSIAILALDGWVGNQGLAPLSPGIGVYHGILAHLFLSSVVMIALFTSQSWKRGPEPVDNRGHTSLRGLAFATPLVVILQITLGALYRHNVTGVLPHMGGALVATILILVVCLIVTQDFADNRSLHSTAVALLSIVLTQISLGIATFTMKLLNFEDTSVFLFSSMLHVLVGSLTLAVTLIMAAQVQRNVRNPVTTTKADIGE